MTVLNRRTAGCSLRPFAGVQGRCDACGATLAGRQSVWCSTECRAAWERNHDWPLARAAALARTLNACERCGVVAHYGVTEIEVNHRDPLLGRGYNRSCFHHQDNLEPLCLPCHRAETARQGRDRRAAGVEQLAL